MRGLAASDVAARALRNTAGKRDGLATSAPPITSGTTRACTERSSKA